MSAARPARAVPLLSDATVPVNFCKAGAGQQMASYLGDEVFVVEEVHHELQRIAAKEPLPALERLLKTWPPTDVITLPLELSLKLADELQFQNGPDAHEAENAGELATIIWADAEAKEGRRYHILTDDRLGKELARDRGYAYSNTPELIVDMVCAGALTYAHGGKVWRETLSRGAWDAYARNVKSRCPDKAPPP